MKAKITIALLLFFSLHIYSQPVKVRPGLKAGLSFTEVKIKPPSNYPGDNRRTGLIGGGFINIYLDKKLFLQPAAIFVRKGGRNYSSFSMSYLEIPLCILYKSGREKGGLFFGGGLSPAFNISRNDYGYQEDVKKFDFGINASAGYLFPIGFSMNLGYTIGILNVSGDEAYTMHNRYFALTAGYEF